ncbi:MAG: DUF935 domain-containing protein [Thauera sp.]|nr:DUF935 domain-containing protein [Thauera sp.]
MIAEEEDLKASSDTDKNVSEMGFELNLDAVRAKYGEGWEKKAPPPVPPPVVAPPAGLPKAPEPGADNANPDDPEQEDDEAEDGTADFAERAQLDGQQAIDDAIAAIPDAELQAAMAGLMKPLLAAIDAADSFEEALAAAEAAYPQMNTVKLQSLLARAMFGAEAFGTGMPAGRRGCSGRIRAGTATRARHGRGSTRRATFRIATGMAQSASRMAERCVLQPCPGRRPGRIAAGLRCVRYRRSSARRRRNASPERKLGMRRRGCSRTPWGCLPIIQSTALRISHSFLDSSASMRSGLRQGRA